MSFQGDATQFVTRKSLRRYCLAEKALWEKSFLSRNRDTDIDNRRVDIWGKAMLGGIERVALT